MSTKKQREKRRAWARSISTPNRAVMRRGWLRAKVVATGKCTGTIEAFIGDQWIDYGALCNGMAIIDESVPWGREQYEKAKEILCKKK